MTAPLFVFALPTESAHHFDDLPTLYTGVGKVQAALTLTHYLHTTPTRPSLIINCGTVGSRVHAPGTIVQCHDFVQRDMDVTPLGFAPYQTPFLDAPVILKTNGPILPNIPVAVCGTGDHFVTHWPDNAPFDVVDMEGFALATIAAHFDIPFLAVKYISDNADGDAHVDWGAALTRAATALRAAITPLCP